MASATLGSNYVVSNEGASTLARLAEHPSRVPSEGFVSRRADSARLGALSDAVKRSSTPSKER